MSAAYLRSPETPTDERNKAMRRLFERVELIPCEGAKHGRKGIPQGVRLTIKSELPALFLAEVKEVGSENDVPKYQIFRQAFRLENEQTL